MTTDKEAANGQPVSKVTVEKDRRGHYFFALTYRGVTYPVKGPFASSLQAAVAGQAALKGLEAQASGRKP
ncbi:MAG: hypothetical protein WA950_16020 [Shinella sp.]|uniref:hypothetical protein n=1 Tax=Shinella sp. TaxID=1870904 RepID=UPI003C7724F4